MSSHSVLIVSSTEGHRFGFEEEEKLYVMDLLGKKIIQPSSSEWAAAPVICMKDGKIPYCMDYRKLNSVTHKDALPLPRMYRRYVYVLFVFLLFHFRIECIFCSFITV
jgi:hypothetical protein